MPITTKPNEITFTRSGEFAACTEAEVWLRDRGFSVGRMQGPDPRGVMFGDFDIQKWRNLTEAHRFLLHGLMAGSMRHGPIVVRLLPSAPVAAMAAFEREAV